MEKRIFKNYLDVQLKNHTTHHSPKKVIPIQKIQYLVASSSNQCPNKTSSTTFPLIIRSIINLILPHLEPLTTSHKLLLPTSPTKSTSPTNLFNKSRTSPLPVPSLPTSFLLLTTSKNPLPHPSYSPQSNPQQHSHPLTPYLRNLLLFSNYPLPYHSLPSIHSLPCFKPFPPLLPFYLHQISFVPHSPAPSYTYPSFPSFFTSHRPPTKPKPTTSHLSPIDIFLHASTYLLPLHTPFTLQLHSLITSIFPKNLQNQHLNFPSPHYPMPSPRHPLTPGTTSLWRLQRWD